MDQISFGEFVALPTDRLARWADQVTASLVNNVEFLDQQLIDRPPLTVEKMRLLNSCSFGNVAFIIEHCNSPRHVEAAERDLEFMRKNAKPFKVGLRAGVDSDYVKAAAVGFLVVAIVVGASAGVAAAWLLRRLH